MAKQTHITWKNHKLAASIDYPNSFEAGGNRAYPIIVICHGFTGSRIGVDRLFVKAADEFNLVDHIVLRFDYLGCGESLGDYGDGGLCDLIDQTHTAINYALNLEQVDPERLILLGHSLGGATALLSAIRDERVKNLILWSAVANPYKDISTIVGSDKTHLLKENNSTIDYKGYQLSKTFFDSLKKYHPLNELKSYKGNVLVVHGTQDQDIPVSYCSKYETAFQSGSVKECNRVEIEGANHTYSCSKHFEELMVATRKWLLNKHSVTIF